MRGAKKWCVCFFTLILAVGWSQAETGREVVVGSVPTETTLTAAGAGAAGVPPTVDVNVVPSPGTDNTIPVARIDRAKPDVVTRSELRGRQETGADGTKVPRIEIKRSPLRGLLASVDPKTVHYGLDLDTPVFVVARGGNVRVARVLNNPNVGWDLTAFDPKSGEEIWYAASVAPEPVWPSAFDALVDSGDTN